MKLSDIVHYLNLLESADMDPDISQSVQRLQGIAHFIANYRVQIPSVADTVTNDVIAIEQQCNKFAATINGLRDQVRNLVAQREPEMFLESQRIYEQEMIFETADWILKRKFAVTDNDLIDLRTRIRNYGDWRLPGMIIRPGVETFIEEMVPLDPLYVVDIHQDLISPAVSKFTPEYQRRLRTYVVNDYRDQEPLHLLPDNQFGFIFAYNFFNYKPLSVIEKYIRDFARKLRPGGRALFTYNECDRFPGVGAAENHFMCYTPGGRIRQIIESAGLELEENRLAQYDLAWMEVRRPGEIKTVRGSQTIAKIMPK